MVNYGRSFFEQTHANMYVRAVPYLLLERMLHLLLALQQPSLLQLLHGSHLHAVVTER
jgi:hypothetical protein